MVVADSAGHVLETVRRFVGHETNNRAEYLALICGLETVLGRGADAVTCYLDSELIVRQVNGAYRVRNPRLRPLYERVLALCGNLRRCSFRHVSRDLNAVADRLANEAIDEHDALQKQA
mgnify:CR=1 FL=1